MKSSSIADDLTFEMIDCKRHVEGRDLVEEEKQGCSKVVEEKSG